MSVRHARKVVLEENEYLNALSSIIDREFFPHSQQRLLGQLDKIEEIDALSSGNPVLIARSLVNRALSAQRRASSSSASASAATATAASSPYTHLSLSQFLSAYTSEDNASFEALQLRDMSDRRRAAHWLFEPGEAAAYAAQAVALDPFLALDRPELAQSESASATGQQPGMLMLYHTHGQHLSVEQRRALDSLLAVSAASRHNDLRPAAPQGSHFRVRNHLMFAPDSDFTHPLSAASGVGLVRAAAEVEEGHGGAAPAPKRIKAAPSTSASSSSEGASSHALTKSTSMGASKSSSKSKSKGKKPPLSAAGAALADRLHAPQDEATRMLRESYSGKRRSSKSKHKHLHKHVPK